MKIAWSRRARQHLLELRAYVELDKPDAAERLSSRIVECVELIRVQPSAGKPGRIQGTRELVISGTPYIVPYRVRARGIEVLGVFHGRQKWPKYL
ncbi:MAG: type II toxin-antitoxin system RelE/ParE family toxin [Bryobacteraceae bacterium]